MPVRTRTRAPMRFARVSWGSYLCVGAAHADQPYTTWREYGGGAHSSQYSALKQIDKSNVARLEVAWTFPSGDKSFSFNPLIVDRTMYVAARDNEIVALDAETSKERWAHPTEKAR